MHISNLVKGDFSGVTAEKPRLLYADRLFSYEVCVGVLVEIVDYKENKQKASQKGISIGSKINTKLNNMVATMKTMANLISVFFMKGLPLQRTDNNTTYIKFP
ncbi:MAG: hypothetical protein QXK47_01965 [Candidatus Bathyarchaeia archaeon]